MREYHFDSYLFLSTIIHQLSIWMTISRPLIILGQDESIFKQYSLSWQYWFGPCGDTKLLLKNDRYGQMISTFISHSIGFWSELTDNELNKVNERRRSGLWSEYLPIEEAWEIYNAAKKQELKDTVTLHQFFDLYFPRLFDQSSGHRKQREGGFN